MPIRETSDELWGMAFGFAWSCNNTHSKLSCDFPAVGFVLSLFKQSFFSLSEGISLIATLDSRSLDISAFQVIRKLHDVATVVGKVPLFGDCHCHDFCFEAQGFAWRFLKQNVRRRCWTWNATTSPQHHIRPSLYIILYSISIWIAKHKKADLK